jgi:hypothetical protein
MHPAHAFFRPCRLSFPNSGFLLDCIGRRYPKAKRLDEKEFPDLILLDEIRRANFSQQPGK